MEELATGSDHPWSEKKKKTPSIDTSLVLLQ
jgi:hypothetical protein